MYNTKAVSLGRKEKAYSLKDFIIEEDQSIMVSKLSVDLKNILICILMSVVFILAISVFQLSTRNSYLAETSSYHSIQYSKMKTQYDTIVNNFDDLQSKYNSVSITNVELASKSENLLSVMTEVNKQNIQLVQSNEDYKEKLKDFENRVELYDKYEYAVFDKGGNRTDITYEQLQLAEDLMTEKGLNPNLLLGIVMTESTGTEGAQNSGSTATGYGQILRSTGKFVYEKLLGKANYNHSMALDGDLNITMTAEYLAYLCEEKSSVREAIYSYRGIRDDGYINKINSYISNTGYSVDKMG